MPVGTRRLVTFRVGWLLVCAGLALGLCAGLVLATTVGSAIDDAFLKHPCATPCDESLHLDAGRYLVFEQVGHSSSVGPVTATVRGPGTFGPDDVSVTSSSGKVLEVGVPSSSQTIERNGTIYGGVVSFRVPVDGRYRVAVHAPGPTRVLVAPSLGRTLVEALPGLAVAITSVGAFVAGTVVLVIAWSRRRKGSSQPGP